MASLPNDTQPQPNGRPQHPADADDHSLDLLLGGGWEDHLWKRLLVNLKDKLAPEKLPPLQLTSRPVNIGMLASDRLNMPWYRTFFTNVGDVISPETLPPLELESQPADVGELISDQMSHPWWSSLLRNLADNVAPERQPVLQLTSRPMDPGGVSNSMALPRWSSVIDTPKVFLPDKPKRESTPVPVRVAPPKPKPDPAVIEFARLLEIDLKRDLRRSQFRQRVWISLAVLEVAFLFYSAIWWK
jgi:hypothetical protein